jgi:hypothetical protein
VWKAAVRGVEGLLAIAPYAVNASFCSLVRHHISALSQVAPDWAVGMQQGQGAGKGAAKKSAALRRHGSRLAAASDCESDSESD